MKNGICALILVMGAYGTLAAGQPPPAFQGLAKTNVIVRIDGRDTTKRDVERDAKMFMTLGMNKERRKKMLPKDYKRFEGYCKHAGEMAINEACLNKYAQTHALTNSESAVSNVTRQIEQRYGVYSKKLKRWHKIDDLKYMLGKNAGRLDAHVQAGATYQMVTNHILSTHPIAVTDAQVNERLSEIAHENAGRAATNAWVYARATNVWQEVVGKKLTFEQAATNYSEDAYLAWGCEWGTFSREHLSDEPAVLELLPTLKAGTVTPPVESDCGLAILRLDEIDQNGCYTFSRIFFRLPRFIEEETPEQARRNLQAEAEKEAVKAALHAMRETLKIDYPSGTNLFANGSAPMKVTKADLAD